MEINSGDPKEDRALGYIEVAIAHLIKEDELSFVQSRALSSLVEIVTDCIFFSLITRSRCHYFPWPFTHKALILLQCYCSFFCASFFWRFLLSFSVLSSPPPFSFFPPKTSPKSEKKQHGLLSTDTDKRANQLMSGVLSNRSDDR